MFPKAFRTFRPEVYRPLPDGWVWPPAPFQPDLTRLKREKKKKPIPQEVLDEWRRARRPRTQAGFSTSSSSGAASAEGVSSALVVPEQDPLDVLMDWILNDDPTLTGEVGEDSGPPLDWDLDLDDPS